MPLYHVKHITRYLYPSLVADSANQIILKPKNSEYQEITEQKIKITPTVQTDYFEDYLGNTVGVFTITEPHMELEIVSDMQVVTQSVPAPEPTVMPEEEWKALAELKFNFEFIDFTTSEVYNSRSAIDAVVKSIALPGVSVYDTIAALSEYIFNTFTYKQGVTSVETGIDEIWDLKAGVCQDFAHLLLEMLRTLGIPSRYISGYICPVADELRGVGATHAWVEAYIPGYGWFGIDPTNNCRVSDRHIKIAFGRNFNDCTPVKGTYKGPSNHKLLVSVSISNEKPVNDVTVHFAEHAPVSAIEPVVETKYMNSYQKFLEMQQQQQQQ